MTLFEIILFLAGLFLLVKGADWFVDGASVIAKRSGVSPFFIGLTVVAFGTSAPEFVVNITSALYGNGDIAVGNILGSNISNTLLILGLAAVIHPLVIRRTTAWKEIPLNLFATIIMVLMSADSLFNGTASRISHVDGLILLTCFIAFFGYSISMRNGGIIEGETIIVETKYSRSKTALMTVGGLAGLILGGMGVVDGAVQIARSMGISEAIIGLTIIAIGTSLPELMTSVVAARKKHADIAVGNIIGSNIFNIFFVLGVTSVITSLPVSGELMNNMLVAAVVAILLVVAVFTGKKYVLEMKDGYIFIALYAAYLLYLVMQIVS